MKLCIVNVDTTTKLLLKFGSLETVCIDGRSKKLLKLTHYSYMYMSDMGLCTHSHTVNFPTLCLYIMKLWIVNVDTVKCTSSLTCETLILCRQLMKLWIMNVYTKPDSVIKFGTSMMLFVDMRPKKTKKVVT